MCGITNFIQRGTKKADLSDKSETGENLGRTRR